jgi:phage gpG-like protein
MHSPFSLVIDDRHVLDVLARLAVCTSPAGLRPAMKEIGEELAESTRQRFKFAVAPDGTPWSPLKPGTVLARYRKMMGESSGNYKKDGSLSKRGQIRSAGYLAAAKNPLRATGELARGIRSQITDGGASVEIGTNRTFSESKGVGAEVHQFGTRTIPARPFLGLSERDKTTVLDILNELLQEAIRP